MFALKPKIIAAVITVLFVNVFLALVSSSDSFDDFIPLVNTISHRKLLIDAYDFFFVIAVLLMRPMFKCFGVTFSGLKRILSIVYPLKPLDIAILVVIGVLTHFCVWPFIYEIFLSPLSAIRNSPDSIRKVVLIVLALFWVLVLALLNFGTRVVGNKPSSSPVQTLPSPPSQW